MNAENPSHAQALAMTDELARGGVAHAVVAPGSRSTALAVALHDEQRIRVHVQIDERSAGFLALGIAKASRRPAVVVTTSGTATANLLPAVVEADTSATPLLVLTTDRPPELRHTASNQTIDQTGLYGRSVRWSVDVGVAEDRNGAAAYWRSTIGRALAEASGLAGRPGPVHLNLPFREPTVPVSDDGRSAADPFRQPLEGRDDGAPWVTLGAGRREPAPADLDALTAAVSGANRGVVVVGATEASSGPLLDVARKRSWPVIAEPLSGARRGPNVITSAHHLLGVTRFVAEHRPELVLRVGRAGISPHLGRLLGTDVPQILVDADGSWLDPQRTLHRLVAADPAATFGAVAERLADDADPGWLRAWKDADGAARAAIDGVLAEDPAPSEPRTARDVAASVPRGGWLVAGSSRPIRDLDQFMGQDLDLRVVGNRGASGIDGFVSTALGVALAAAPASTTALVGDLSLLHDSNGFLASLDAEEVSLALVVVNNDGGGIFHFLPQERYAGPGFERLFATPHGRDIADLARLHGIPHREVKLADELGPAIEDARGGGGVRLVEVRTDRHANVALHRRVAEAVDRALA